MRGTIKIVMVILVILLWSKEVALCSYGVGDKKTSPPFLKITNFSSWQSPSKFRRNAVLNKVKLEIQSALEYEPCGFLDYLIVTKRFIQASEKLILFSEKATKNGDKEMANFLWEISQKLLDRIEELDKRYLED